MTDDDYVRLRDLIRSTADASGWASSLPDGAVGRLIPGDLRRPDPPGRPLPPLPGGPEGLGIVIVTPVPSGGFVMLARFDPVGLWPDTQVLLYERQLRVYDDPRPAMDMADGLVECGHAPSKWSRHRGARAHWRIDPPAYLMPTRYGFSWTAPSSRVELDLLPHLRPVHLIDPATAAPVLAARPPIQAIAGGGAIYKHNRIEAARWLVQNPTAPSDLAAAPVDSPLEIAWRSRNGLLGACFRHMVEDGVDAAACGRLAERYAPPDDIASMVMSLRMLSPCSREGRIGAVPATDVEECAYAAVVAELDLHRHPTLRAPLDVFRNATTDLQRAAIADRLPEAIEQEIAWGGLGVRDVQPILDNWTAAHRLPRIVCNMRHAI